MESDKSSHFRQQATDLPVVQSFPLPDHATLKVALEPGYSIQFDDLPSKFQIRIMDRRSPSPAGIHHDSALDPPDSPRQRWMDDYGPPRWEDQQGVVRLPPSEIRLPTSHSRPIEQMQEEVRGDMNENPGGIVGFRETTCETCNTVGIGAEVIYLRRPSEQFLSTVEGKKGSPRPYSNLQSSDFINCQRPSRNFPKNNILVDNLDITEMHPDLTHQAAPKKMPPDEAYNATKYSSPPESPRSASPGRCSWHREDSCPMKAGYRCRENTGYESPARDRDGGEGGEDVDNVRCTFHRKQSCPAQAGVRCRNERSVSPPVSRSGRKDESGSSFNSSFPGYSCNCRP